MNYDEHLNRQAENYYEGEKMMNSLDFEATKRNLYDAVKEQTGIKLLDSEAEAFTDKLVFDWDGESEEVEMNFMDKEITVKVEIIERTKAEYMMETERGN